MKRYFSSGLFLTCVLLALAAVVGCCINIGNWCRAKVERTDHLSAPMTEVEAMSAQTSFGEVTVTGRDDVNECSVTAHITVQAPSEEEAGQILNQVQVALEPQGKTLVIKTKQPHLKSRRSIGVDLNIILPTQTRIDCSTSFGEIKITNIKGDVKAETSFGAIQAENVTGKIHLDTSHGAIRCRQIVSSDFAANTSFGEINVSFGDTGPNDITAKLTTSFGAIEVAAPPSFAGQVDSQTSFGSIKTELPLTVKGDFSKDHISGAVGEGNGKLSLNTSFGSIKIK